MRASSKATWRRRSKQGCVFLQTWRIMQNLGHTRSARRADHILQTPDTFVRAPLPGMSNATAIVHAAPAAGARFTQYTAEFEAGGSLAAASVQRFVYVLEGELEIDGHALATDGFAYLPAGG